MTQKNLGMEFSWVHAQNICVPSGMHKTVMYHIKYMLTNSVLILFYTINNPQERSAVSTIVVAAQVFTFESYFVLF